MTEVAPLLWSNLKDITTPNEAALKSATPKEEPTKQEFLRLFMAQLKNQDPLAPMDQQDITAQLATFTSLEKQIEGNKTLDDIRASLRGQESWQAASWVGKNVRIDAAALTYEGAGESTLHYRLPDGVAGTEVRVVDDAGTLVRTFSSRDIGDNAHTPGDHLLVWDGKDHRGQQAAQGTYRVEVEAVDKDGRALSGATTQLVGRLTGVELEGGQVRLKVAGQRVRPQDVLEVL